MYRSIPSTVCSLMVALAWECCFAPSSQVYADPKDANVEKGERLFAEGKALITYNALHACAKFDESLHYDPTAIATLMNVALCDEKRGRVASAVAKFSEARELASRQGLSQHARGAEEHIAALTPSVPHVTIKLTDDVVDAKVTVDDRIVAREMITNVPVDPGERVIVVTAPKRVPYRTTITIEKAEHRDLVVVLLSGPIVVVSNSQRRIGQTFTAVGGAAIVGGIGVGLYARQLYLSQFGHKEPGDGLCTEMNICEPAGKAATDRAITLGNVGTAIGLVGVGVAGLGVYLWYRSPSATAPTIPKLAIVPHLTFNTGGIIAVGQF